MSDRILLLEDEETLAHALLFNLRREGFVVTHAATCADALSEFDQRFDLFLLDRMLPDGDGLEICRELRRRCVLSPILILTAKTGAQSTVNGLEAGADDYLAKPFDIDELLGRVRALLRRFRWSGVQTVERQMFGQCWVELANLRGGGPRGDVDLTELEARLLGYLLQHSERSISRAELLENVWRIAPKSQTRVVDNFVVRLRRLLEPDPANPRHILTVRGVGYRLVL